MLVIGIIILPLRKQCTLESEFVLRFFRFIPYDKKLFSSLPHNKKVYTKRNIVRYCLRQLQKIWKSDLAEVPECRNV